MTYLEQIVTNLSLDELNQLERIITQQKLRKNPIIKADLAYKSQLQDAIYVLERKIKGLKGALKSYRRKLETEIYVGYRIRQFDGVEWTVIEEAGDTTKFKKVN